MLIKFLRRLFSNATKKVVNEKEACLEEQEQTYDDEVSRLVNNYIKNFSGLKKCRYLYFGRGIPQEKLEFARKYYTDYDHTQEHPLLLIETKLFGIGILTNGGILLTNKNMYFEGVADIPAGSYFEMPEGKGSISLNYLNCAEAEYSLDTLEFGAGFLKINARTWDPVILDVGTDNVRFLKGLFTLLMDNEALKRE